MSRTIPYLNSLSRTMPYLIHWAELYPILQHFSRQPIKLRHPSRQPIRIEYYVTRQPIKIEYYVTRVTSQSESSITSLVSQSESINTTPESSANRNRVIRHPRALGLGGGPLSAIGSSRFAIDYFNTWGPPPPVWSAHSSTTIMRSYNNVLSVLLLKNKTCSQVFQTRSSLSIFFSFFSSIITIYSRIWIFFYLSYTERLRQLRCKMYQYFLLGDVNDIFA